MAVAFPPSAPADLTTLVYTRIDGKLAAFKVEAGDVEEARQAVIMDLLAGQSTVLALV